MRPCSTGRCSISVISPPAQRLPPAPGQHDCPTPLRRIRVRAGAPTSASRIAMLNAFMRRGLFSVMTAIEPSRRTSTRSSCTSLTARLHRARDGGRRRRNSSRCTTSRLKYQPTSSVIGHAHAAMQLHGLLADVAARLSRHHLRGRNRAAAFATIRGRRSSAAASNAVERACSMAIAMSAARCCSAWKLPIGWPNWRRVRRCSPVISSRRSIAPTASAQSAAMPRSIARSSSLEAVHAACRAAHRRRDCDVR